MNSDLLKAVGANIRRLRYRRGLSQEAFADVVGMHRTYVGGVERGERNLTLRSIERIAEGAGVSVWEILRPPAEDSEVE